MNFGGERGIRTLEGLLALTPLAGVRLRPLGHLSGGRNHKDPGRLKAKIASGGQGFPGHAGLAVGGGIAIPGRASVFDALGDLFAMDGHVLRRIDADPHLVALHAEDRHGDVFADHH